MQQLCGFACRLIYRTTFICCIFKTCLRPVRRLLASFVHFFNKNFYAADGDKWLCPRDSASSGYFFTHHDCCSLNMSDVDGSDAMQSQIWKRVVSFKRKLLGGSSVLPSSILEVVTRKSQNILSLQSNSAQMPNYVSSCSKRPKLELKHSAMTPDNTVVTIPEDFEPGPRSNATQECCMSSESLDSVSLLFGDELVALFDSDNQKKTGTCASASSGKSEFLPLTKAIYCLYDLLSVDSLFLLSVHLLHYLQLILIVACRYRFFCRLKSKRILCYKSLWQFGIYIGLNLYAEVFVNLE